MSMKKTSAPVELSKVVRIPLKDIFLGPNQGRDNTIGDHGHTDERVASMVASIKLEGDILQPVILGTKGYTDEDVIGTPAEMYPILDGVRRFLGYRKLAQDNPTEEKWRSIPAIIRQTESGSFHASSITANLIRAGLTSLEKAKGLAAYKNRNNLNHEQMSILFELNVATIRQLEKLLVLTPALKDLLNDSELDRNLWSDTEKKTNVREGIEYKRLTFAFAQKIVTRVQTLLRDVDKIPVPMPEDYGKYLNMVHAHWDKTGQWSEEPLEAVAKAANVDLVKKRKETPKDDGYSALADAIMNKGESQSNPETPNTQSESITPGNGADKGMGRADQSGNPKSTPPSNDGKSVREMMGKPKNENNGPWEVVAGAKDIGEMLASFDSESAKALGNIILKAKYYLVDSAVKMSGPDREKFIQALAIAFPKVESAGS